MKGFLSHYTPSLMNPEDLDAIFVQRQPLLTDLLENIERSVLTEAKHHALLIGPRGIGKTHLISMIYHRVSANEIFKDKLKIAWLREEEWGIATFLDLLVRILNALIEEYQDQDLETKVKDLYSVSTEQAEQLAGQILKKYCQDQTLLLLMENLDEIFKGLDESGQQAFRAYLQNYGFITIVATSQSLFSGVKSRDLPFYGFFSLTHLKPLVLEEAVDLLANIAKWRGDQDLADLLITPLGKSRIRAIHHLAGGNHRIYIIFSQFLTTESLDSLVEPFMKTLDDLTPFYQSRMQFISPQQRKIIQHLCEPPGKFSVKEIAQHCFISPQTASSQLKQLRELGYIYADSEGRESFYELQEPLMRIWLDMKKCRGTSNQLFINFLRVWFSSEELENRLEILPLEASFDRKCTIEERKTSDNPNIAALLRDWNEAKNNAQYKKMLELSEKLILVRGSGLDWIKAGQSHFHLDQINAAIQCFDKAIAIEPDNHEIWQLRGLELYEIELFPQSLLSYEKAIELNPKTSLTWSQKALVEAKMEHKKQAIDSIEKAISLDEENNEIWGNALLVYTIIRDKEHVDQCLEKILTIAPDDDRILQNLALSLKNIDVEEGIKCIKKAININKKSSESYRILAMLYLFGTDNKQALDAINKSIHLRETDSMLWYAKAAILIQMKLFTDATKCLHQCIKLEEDFSNKIKKGVAYSSKNTLKLWMKKHLLIYIFKLGNELENWLEESQSMLEIYDQHHLLNDLSGGLVESIKAINETSTSDHTAQAWLEMWQDLAGNYSEFQVALNLLKVAVEYKINRDRRVLLQLPQEERQILEELLNPETV